MTRCAETLLATLTYSAQTINGKDSPHIEASDWFLYDGNISL